MATILKVTGMTCQHCVQAVTKALKNVPGVVTVSVSLERGQVVVEGTASREALVSAVKEVGYEAG